MRRSFLIRLSALVLAAESAACPLAIPLRAQAPATTPAPRTSVVHPVWSRRAVIYEVNLRQYTAEGTLTAFQRHIPRLRALGVDVIWLTSATPAI